MKVTSGEVIREQVARMLEWEEWLEWSWKERIKDGKVISLVGEVEVEPIIIGSRRLDRSCLNHEEDEAYAEDPGIQLWSDIMAWMDPWKNDIPSGRKKASVPNT